MHTNAESSVPKENVPRSKRRYSKAILAIAVTVLVLWAVYSAFTPSNTNPANSSMLLACPTTRDLVPTMSGSLKRDPSTGAYSAVLNFNLTNRAQSTFTFTKAILTLVNVTLPNGTVLVANKVNSDESLHTVSSGQTMGSTLTLDVVQKIKSANITVMIYADGCHPIELGFTLNFPP